MYGQFYGTFDGSFGRVGGLTGKEKRICASYILVAFIMIGLAAWSGMWMRCCAALKRTVKPIIWWRTIIGHIP